MDGDEDAAFGFMFLAQTLQRSQDLHRIVLQNIRREGGTLLREEQAVPEKGPGRGVPKLGEKAKYERSESRKYYQFVRDHHNPLLFENHIHHTREEFDALHDLVKDEMNAPLNPRLALSRDENLQRQSRPRILSSKEMLFFYLHTLGGGNEGGAGLLKLYALYGASVGTMSNWFSHVACAVHYSLKSVEEARIKWPYAAERQGMRGLVYGFPNAVAFCDGCKCRVFRPMNHATQQLRYDGHHKIHCFAVLVWVDVFGTYIRLDISLLGSQHDRGIFNQSGPMRSPNSYFFGEEHCIGDTGFQGEGRVVCPMKSNQGMHFVYRAMFNKDLRRQRVCNEWGVGYINNRFRMFLGRWPFSPELFPICYESVAMMANWRWRRRGETLVPLQRRLERVAQREKHLYF